MIAMFVSLIALVGMVSSGPATPAHDRDRDPESETSEYRFGRVLTIFTVICGIVLAIIIVAGIFSFFGAFTEEIIDPLV